MPEMQKRLTTQVHGVIVSGYVGDYIFETIKNTGEYYEEKTLRTWTPLWNSAKVILDIGANLGNHTLYWAERLSPKTIFSFEPYAPNYENLVINIQQNGLEHIVQPVAMAVGKCRGIAKLDYTNTDNFGGTTFSVAEGAETGVTMISIDEFVREHAVQEVSFIKIDTEGFEIDILKGALVTLQRDRPMLWVEVSEQSFSQILMLLDELNYDLADVEAFNMLFLPSEKNDTGYHISREKLLSSMFSYETKTNTYYHNYTIAKAWNETNVSKCKKLEEERDALKTQLLEAEKKADEAKSSLEQQRDELTRELITKRELESKLDHYIAIARQYTAPEPEDMVLAESLAEKLEEDRCIKDDLADLTLRFVEQGKESELLIDELLRQLNKSLAQIRYLKNENKTYREKLNKITSVWFGRLGIRIYKASRKLHGKMHGLLEKHKR